MHGNQICGLYVIIDSLKCTETQLTAYFWVSFIHDPYVSEKIVHALISYYRVLFLSFSVCVYIYVCVCVCVCVCVYIYRIKFINYIVQISRKICCLLVLITEKGISKISQCDVCLSIYPCWSVKFCFIWFETVLLSIFLKCT